MPAYSENLSKLLLNINKEKEKYKILSREEELVLIEKYRNSDPAYLKNLLICHNIYLAISFSKHYCNTSIDYDSLLQDAFYGLVIAAEKFDYDAGVKFSRYAYIWIKKYALSSYYDRHNMKIGLNSVSLDATIHSNNVSGGGDTSSILQDIFNIEAESECSEYDKYLNYLPIVDEYEKTDTEQMHSQYYVKILHMVETSADITIEEKQIFKYLYVNGLTLNTIAKELNMPVQNIRYKKQKLLNHLKNVMAKEHNITLFANLD
jgi:RNA polymerase sigma factor (sigma-70 family)